MERGIRQGSSRRGQEWNSGLPTAMHPNTTQLSLFCNKLLGLDKVKKNYKFLTACVE